MQKTTVVTFRVDEEKARFLSTIADKSEFIRDLIDESPEFIEFIRNNEPICDSSTPTFPAWESYLNEKGDIYA